MTDYQYRALEPTQIRVLTLLPGRSNDGLVGLLNHRRFIPGNKDKPEYEALSYFWGPVVRTEHVTLIQDGQPRNSLVGPNLAVALRHLRHSEKARQIWCDGICINQDDLIERAAQVRRMGDIYREADGVIAWLGPEQDNSTNALRILDHIGSNVHFDAAKYELFPRPEGDPKLGDLCSVISYDDNDWLSIEKLFARDWFNRLWVRQEIVLAKRAVVVAGDASTTWARLGQAAGCLEVKISMGTLDAHFSVSFKANIRNTVALFRTTLFRHPVSLLNFTRECQCKDDRDRVYSLLGLMSSSYTIQPDYSRGIRDVCKEMMMSVYKEDARLDILALCDITASPSWVPNIPGNSPASHFWRNFATGYSEAQMDLKENDRIGLMAIFCGEVDKLLGPLPSGCADDELKQHIRDIMVQRLGNDSAKWDEETTLRITQAVLGGHWIENTRHHHDPPLREAMSILREWATDDSASSAPFLDMLTSWAILNTLSGWSVFETTRGHFGIGGKDALPGDQIFAVPGCKDTLLLRGTTGLGYLRIVGPAYMYHLSCGQAILGDGMRSPSFIDAFDHPDLSIDKGDGLGKKGDPHLEHIDYPYEVEDDHPIWHRERERDSTSRPGTTHLRYNRVLRGRGVSLKELILE